ncbi:MAG: RHS repeat domain-containing protein [Pirellulaceae bacterium]
MTEASDPDGELQFVYDYIGRITSETQIVDGLTPHIVLATKYDAASNRTELAATLGSNADFKNTYLYDNDNRMTRVTQQSNSGNTLATKRVDFSYNALSQFDTISRYQNTGGTNVVATTTFTYDTLNRLSTLNHDQGGTTLNHYTYGYDRMDRLNSISSTAEGSETFTYDKTSQLTGADHSTQSDETYTFDANGNRTMSGYTTTTNNLTTSDGTYNYTYDDEGNRTRKTNISTGAYEQYTWDYRNRLTNVTSKTAGGTVTKTVDEHYDILNRWTRRHTDPDGPGATAARDNFFAYDGIEPIYQFDGPADTDLIDRYLWGPAVDQILVDEQVTSLGSAGNIIHPLMDHLGTGRDLADQNESTYTTTITNHRTYNGFGLLTSESNSSVDCDPSYTGKITDSDTNLQPNLYRSYDAVLGQWPSEDPIIFHAGDPNIRRSVTNSPMQWKDPLGLVGACIFSKDYVQKMYHDKDSDEYKKGHAQSLVDTYIGVAAATTIMLGIAEVGFLPFLAQEIVEEGAGVPIIPDPLDAAQLVVKKSFKDAVEKGATNTIEKVAKNGMEKVAKEEAAKKLSKEMINGTSSTLKPLGPGVGTKAVMPTGFGMGKTVAGKHAALMIDGKVYVHHHHLGAQALAGKSATRKDLYGWVELDELGNVVKVGWVEVGK